MVSRFLRRARSDELFVAFLSAPVVALWLVCFFWGGGLWTQDNIISSPFSAFTANVLLLLAESDPTSVFISVVSLS